MTPDHGMFNMTVYTHDRSIAFQRYIHRWKAMDHGYLLTLSIHLAEIPTSPQNFANTLELK